MRIEDIDAPLVEPIDLAYAKTFLRVDTDDEDSLIADMIIGARIRVENLIQSSLILRRRLYRSDAVNVAGLCLTHKPVAAVESVNLIDRHGQSFGVELERLSINLRTEPAIISLETGKTFQDFGSEICAVEIEIQAGYGENAEDIPMPLRQAVLLLLAQSFEHRDQGGGSARPAVPMMVDALLMPYRSLRL